ncbi:MAG: IS4 family transposase [Bacteroidales bacterium]|nr:IS4 family transposase [Bacteroidales bacterium]
MNVSKYVFSQLISFLSRSQFNDFVRKYRGDYYVKHFTCWNQLLVMIFGQLSNRESLRDLIVALEAHQPKCYHMGMGSKPVTKTTLARVNQDRDYRIFEDFAFYMMAQARGKRVVDIFKLNGNVYAFDSTTIDLCLSVFEWALFRKRKGGVKVHTLYDIEPRVPTFFHITPARVHDMKAMDAIPYEENSFYIFDRGYNDF